MAQQRKPTADRKREIVDAAIAVMARDGVGRFTTATLASEVGLTTGALFRHFSTLEQVALSAVDRVEEILFEDFPPTDSDPMNRLGVFFCRRLSAIRKHPSVFRVVYSDELAQVAGEDGARRLRECKRRSIAFVRDCLEEADRQQCLTDAGAPSHLALIVVGTMMALALPGDPRDVTRARDITPEEIWKALERMLRNNPASSSKPRGGNHKKGKSA